MSYTNKTRKSLTEGYRRLGRAQLISFVALVLSLALFLFNIKLFLIPTVIGVLAANAYFPRLFLNSYFSRLIFSSFITFALIQLSALVQYFLFPESGFRTLGTILMLLTLLTVIFHYSIKSAGNQERISSIFDRKDLASLAMAIIFVVPLSLLLGGAPGGEGLVKRAALQSVDASHHSILISETSYHEHLVYDSENSYPKGFHLATAFVQDSVYLDPNQHSWVTNTKLFAGQYIVSGVLLSIVLFYLCHSLLAAILGATTLSLKNNIIMAVSLGIPLNIFYLLPFFYHGFLNYYYVCATFACALLYGYALCRGDDWSESEVRWSLSIYLLLILGVSISWPLLTVPMMVIPLLLLLSKQHISIKRLVPRLIMGKNLPIILLIAVQFLPIYIQLKYSSDSTHGINAAGGITTFHYGFILLGLAYLFWASQSSRLNDIYKSYVSGVFVPLFGFLAALMTLQYFTIGELRYYSIKSALLIEVVLLAFLVAFIIATCLRNSRVLIQDYLLILILPFAAILLLSGNPLKDVRELSAGHSNFPEAPYHAEDVAKYTQLGKKGYLTNANSTTIYFDQSRQTILGNQQISYWANSISYNPSVHSKEARLCSSEIFRLVVYEPTTPSQQQSLINKVRECAWLAKQAGQKYYLITNEASKQYLQNLFEEAEIV